MHHLRLTSTPGDDLAEEDFSDRVHSLLKPMTNLASLTICIPTMARLHPSNSLPKVLDVLRDASLLHPNCRLGLVVHEAEQAWGALTILTRIVDLKLALHSIEFSRAFFPAEALIHAAKACGLASLTLHATQVFPSSPDAAAAAATKSNDSIPTLTSFTAHAHSEASPGLDSLLHTASSTLTHLNLSSNSNESGGVTLRDRDFPHLTQLHLHEDLLPEATHARMPSLQDLVMPTLTQTSSCDAIQSMLQPSWPRVRDVRISRVIAGEVSEAFTRLRETHPSVNVTISELAVREPARVTPAALAISEHLINAGPPITGDWPTLGFAERTYPRLKSVVLKVHEGSNHDAFIALLDAPNLDSPPSVSLIGKKKGKAGKK